MSFHVLVWPTKYSLFIIPLSRSEFENTSDRKEWKLCCVDLRKKQSITFDAQIMHKIVIQTQEQYPELLILRVKCPIRLNKYNTKRLDLLLDIAMQIDQPFM